MHVVSPCIWWLLASVFVAVFCLVSGRNLVNVHRVSKLLSFSVFSWRIGMRLVQILVFIRTEKRFEKWQCPVLSVFTQIVTDKAPQLRHWFYYYSHGSSLELLMNSHSCQVTDRLWSLFRGVLRLDNLMKLFLQGGLKQNIFTWVFTLTWGIPFYFYFSPWRTFQNPNTFVNLFLVGRVLCL